MMSPCVCFDESSIRLDVGTIVGKTNGERIIANGDVHYCRQRGLFFRLKLSVRGTRKTRGQREVGGSVALATIHTWSYALIQ